MALGLTLEKLKILVEDDKGRFSDTVTVLFNPNQVSIQKSSNWRLIPATERDTPAAQFTYGEPATLTVDLLFDTYEDGTDVREYTQKLYQLTTIEKHGELHRPPLVQLQWGNY